MNICYFCKPAPVIINVGDWQNDTCFINDTLKQKKMTLEFDSNYSNCYAITHNITDLWNNGQNKTDWDYRGLNLGCNYCSQDIRGSFNTTWTQCINATKYYTEYYIDNNYTTCCKITGLSTDCEINNIFHQNRTYSQSCNNFTIFSPLNNSNLNSKNILVNITSKYEVMKNIAYIDNSDENPRWKTVCANKLGCKTNLGFSSGWHNIRARGISVNETYYDSSAFFVDNISPKIGKTYPKINFYANSSTIFTFNYTEVNPAWVNLYINGERKDALQINSGDKPSFSGFLESYDGEDILYSFDLMDIAGNTVKSKPLNVHVDTSPPEINNPDTFWRQGQGKDSKNIYFDISIDELNLDSVKYFDSFDGTKAKWNSLCSRLDKNSNCVKKKSFKAGVHNLTIRVLDKARNSVEKSISFTI